MTLIQTVSPKDAEGKVKQVYDFMTQKAGVIPKPLKMLSLSPNLLELGQQSLAYFLRHPTLGLSLLGHIRMLVALHLAYDYCIQFNADVLRKYAGTSDDQLSAVKKDPSQADLSEKDKAMLLFVLKAVQTPEATEQADIDRLRGFGWTDTDILDATFHGADMVRHGIMFKALQMDRE
jgi:alkylhydroperoxidase family enzyme